MLKEIIGGWKNYYFENEAVETIAKIRAEVCSTCPHAKHSEFIEIIDFKPEPMKGLVCDVCDCPLSKKTRSLTSKCDLNKWKQ